MRASRIVIALAGSVALAAALSAHAQAYCLKQVPGVSGISAWKGEVSYYVSDTLTDAAKKAAVDAAFKTWQDVSCATITFKNAGTFAIPDVPFKDHGKNGIYLFWYTDAAGYPTDPKYTAYSSFGVDGAGAINQASIAVNGFANPALWSTAPSATELDVQGEVTALIGQVIGIAKSNVAASIMNGTMATGDTSKRTLKQDDIDAVSYLYPEAGCTPPAPGADGCTGSAPPPGDGSVTPPPGDGSVTPPPGDGSVTPKGDGSSVTPKGDGGSSGYDFGTTPPGGCTNDNQCGSDRYCAANGTCMVRKADSGCCAVASSEPPLTAVLIGVAFATLLGVGRRRRR